MFTVECEIDKNGIIKLNNIEFSDKENTLFAMLECEATQYAMYLKMVNEILAKAVGKATEAISNIIYLPPILSKDEAIQINEYLKTDLLLGNLEDSRSRSPPL